MKNDTINFILILISYFAIGLFFSASYVQNERIKTMNDSINRLILIELITQEQFDLLDAKVRVLEKFNQKNVVQLEGEYDGSL